MQKDTNYIYTVSNNIHYRLDQESHEAVSTYKIVFKKIENENFVVEVNRNDFKINTKEIRAKFAKIAYEYTTALFPVQFTTQKLDFEYAETKVEINHDFFEYQETLYISAINT